MSELTDGPMNDDDLLGILHAWTSDALGDFQDDLVGNRAQALDYYFGRKPGAPAIDGRSDAISTDVADTVEALMAQIMPTFASDTTATFEANSEQDEEQAQLESDVVNYWIMEKSDGYKVFYEAIKDALLLKNGIIKVCVDEREKLEIKQYPQLDEMQLAYIQAQTEGEVYAEDNEEGTVVKTVRPTRKLRIEAVAPEDIALDASQRDQDLSECRFIQQTMMVTQTDLLEMGVDPDIVTTLPTYQRSNEVDELARNQTDMEDEHESYEPSSRLIEVFEAHVTLDYDGDGIAELRRVLYTSKDVLINEYAPWIPFASGTPFINPHRWVGISVYDKLREIANQKTVFLRQYEDNMVNHNNRRLGVVTSQLYDVTEAVNSRPGGIIQMKKPGAVQEIPVSDIGPSCINILNYLDKTRTERTGASLDMQAEGLPTGNDTAHGVERQMSFKEQLAGMITKTLAETMVKQVYLITHRTLKAYFPEQIAVRKNGQWKDAEPGSWGEREHVSIDVGMSQGERLRQAQTLQTVLGAQMQLIQAGMGGIVADASKIFNTVMDYCRMSGLDNPAQYWIDPTSPQAQQTAMAQMQQAQQQAMGAEQTKKRIIDIEEFRASTSAQEGLRDYELKVAEQLLKSEDTEDDNRRAWKELDLKYTGDAGE